MMLRFIDSFDHYATADITTKWTTSAGATISSTTGRFRSGTQGITIPNQQATVKQIDNQATWIVGFAMKLASVNSSTNVMCNFLDSGTTQVELRLDSAGFISVTRNGSALTNGTATVAISQSGWNYIEWKVTIADSISAGSCKVRLNGTDIITVATSQDTKNTANAFANQFRLFGPNTDMYIDDLYLCDGTGSTNNDFLGDVKVVALTVTGAGSQADWTPSAGSNYQNVDDTTPNGDTDYNSDSTAGHIDLFALSDLSGTGTVYGIQTNIYARKDDAGTRTIAPQLKSGGTQYTKTSVNVTSSFSFYNEIVEQDPATSAAWTVTNVNALEAGTKLIA